MSTRHRVTWPALCLALAACQDPNTGVPPPRDGIFFPAGLRLDPRTPPGEPAKYLMINNGNNDLSFNAGSIIVVDIDAFFAAWHDPDLGVYPFCEDVELDDDGRPQGRCVLDPGSETSDRFPCRRLSLLPQVVECDEGPFVVDSVRLGDFATVLETSRERDGVPRMWVPVRGDPSITFVDVKEGPNGEPDLECGQGSTIECKANDPDDCWEEFDDVARCGDSHRLRNLRDDNELPQIEREPFTISISEQDEYRYAYVAHSSGPALTLIDLDGLIGTPRDRCRAGTGPCNPSVVDSFPLFLPLGQARTGGFGIQPRPCSVAEDNAPSITQSCERPLVYGAFRFQPVLVAFTASGLDNDDLPDGMVDRNDNDSCMGDADGDGTEEFLGPFCGEPQQLGQPCAIVCEPAVQAARQVLIGGVDPITASAAPVLGDIAFADDRGDELYVLQTNPGALLKVDTSVDDDGETVDVSSAPPIEICAEPSRMQISDGFAYITCFRAAFIYVVDLAAHRVVEAIVAGTGPHDLVVDPWRKVLYAANALEFSVSVIDIDPLSPTRFSELARIGLQDPFSR